MKTLSTLLALLSMTAGAVHATPASAAASSTAQAAATRFQVGLLHVERHGEHGQPVILVPGLGSGAWVWQGTVAQLQGKHVVYSVTLAGFDGTPVPARKTGLMDQVDAALLALIKTRHIDKPVLIGHSLGGTLAIRFATEHSDLIAGVVAVDGLPIFPGFEKMTAQQRDASAARMQQVMAQATPEQFRAQQVGYMQMMGVIDPAAAQKYGALQARSDAATVAEFMAEDLRTDLRPALPNIRVPLLEISPYNAPDFEKAAAMSKQPVTSEAAKTAYYQQLLQGAPHAKVVSISPARHFVMLDQPKQFQAAIDAFLTRIAAP